MLSSFLLKFYVLGGKEMLKRFTVILQEDVWKLLKLCAQMEGRTLRELLRKITEEYAMTRKKEIVKYNKDIIDITIGKGKK